MTNLNDNEQEILADPSASLWLKEQLRNSHERDIADMLNDIDALKGCLERRFCQQLFPDRFNSEINLRKE